MRVSIIGFWNWDKGEGETIMEEVEDDTWEGKSELGEVGLEGIEMLGTRDQER